MLLCLSLPFRHASMPGVESEERVLLCCSGERAPPPFGLYTSSGVVGFDILLLFREVISALAASPFFPDHLLMPWRISARRTRGAFSPPRRFLPRHRRRYRLGHVLQILWHFAHQHSVYIAEEAEADGTVKQACSR